MTNREVIMAMSDEKLAKYLFYRGNCQEYCDGICVYQDEPCHASSYDKCIQGIVQWLNTENEEPLLYDEEENDRIQ